MARSLCLDIGLRRIGLAVSDESKLIARPLAVVTVPKGATPGGVLAEIASAAEAQKADEIVLGLPLHEDGTRGEQAGLVEALAEALRGRTGLPVHLLDERYSTAQAQEILRAKTRKRRDRHDDALAAAVILQRWLDARRGPERTWNEPGMGDDE